MPFVLLYHQPITPITLSIIIVIITLVLLLLLFYYYHPFHPFILSIVFVIDLILSFLRYTPVCASSALPPYPLHQPSECLTTHAESRYRSLR